ncbi:hypothetical protein G5714_011427 [Onychostoma macrolepis]|uniref:Uncharacterized protein n=1 Tax=Onychostoma macrolepis TaxID=369639 RepID=A0A7J6CKN4_9TELE|nr:hypothetical protein G5714_011427 [Onychostoma macrolepis]
MTERTGGWRKQLKGTADGWRGVKRDEQGAAVVLLFSQLLGVVGGVPARRISRGALGGGLEVLGAAGEASGAPLIVAGRCSRRPPLGRCGFCSFVSHHWRRCSRRALPEALQPP